MSHPEMPEVASVPANVQATEWFHHPERSAARAVGALLGLAYCLGLGIPFVLVALGARWAVGATSFLRRNAQTVTRVGGALLVLVGLLLVTGMWTDLMFWLRSWAASTGIGSSL